MKEFDYIIIGGGCAGLSLAYELEIHNKLKDKNLAIIEPRDEYKRDKTWSFWKVFPHNYEDCVKKSWSNFTINSPNETKYVECQETPYQTIDSGLFYNKILSKLKLNKNIIFLKNVNEVNKFNSIIFNSVPQNENQKGNFVALSFKTTKCSGVGFILKGAIINSNLYKRTQLLSFLFVIPFFLLNLTSSKSISLFTFSIAVSTKWLLSISKFSISKWGSLSTTISALRASDKLFL